MVRKFDLGGKIPEDFGPIYMIASHDESCFKAGEYCDRAWTHKDDKETCRNKSDGPSLHIASYSVEWGNGKINTDPTSEHPAPPIHLNELKRYIAAKKAYASGAGPKPTLPASADVFMYPGSSQGYLSLIAHPN